DREARGRTGLWLLSSESHVESPNLNDHLAYLLDAVFPPDDSNRLEHLRAMIDKDELEVDVSCFWYGEHGAEPPAIPDQVRSAYARIGATIEADFDTD